MEETITFLARILSDAFQPLNGGIENLLPISRTFSCSAPPKSGYTCAENNILRPHIGWVQILHFLNRQVYY